MSSYSRTLSTTDRSLGSSSDDFQFSKPAENIVRLRSPSVSLNLGGLIKSSSNREVPLKKPNAQKSSTKQSLLVLHARHSSKNIRAEAAKPRAIAGPILSPRPSIVSSESFRKLSIFEIGESDSCSPPSSPSSSSLASPRRSASASALDSRSRIASNSSVSSAPPHIQSEINESLPHLTADAKLKLQIQLEKQFLHIQSLAADLKKLPKSVLTFTKSGLEFKIDSSCISKSDQASAIEAVLNTFKNALNFKSYYCKGQSIAGILSEISTTDFFKSVVKASDNKKLRKSYDEVAVLATLAETPDSLTCFSKLINDTRVALEKIALILGSNWSICTEGGSISVDEKFISEGENSLLLNLKAARQNCEKMLSNPSKYVENLFVGVMKIIKDVQQPASLASKSIEFAFSSLIKEFSTRLAAAGVLTPKEAKQLIAEYAEAWPTGDASIGEKRDYKKVSGLINSLCDLAGQYPHFMYVSELFQKAINTTEENDRPTINNAFKKLFWDKNKDSWSGEVQKHLDEMNAKEKFYLLKYIQAIYYDEALKSRKSKGKTLARFIKLLKVKTPESESSSSV